MQMTIKLAKKKQSVAKSAPWTVSPHDHWCKEEGRENTGWGDQRGSWDCAAAQVYVIEWYLLVFVI